MDTLEEFVIRTASKFDLEQLGLLFTDDSTKRFGDKQDLSLNQLFIEYQSHRFVVHLAGSPQTLLAYAEFCIYPNIPVLSNDLWPQWLKCRFCVDVPLTLMNTMFFNFCIYNQRHTDILKELIMELFYCEHKINYLIVARPPSYSFQAYAQMEDFGRVYYPSSFDMFDCKNLPTIIVISRERFMPIIVFRKALPEDNDDVIDMIDVEEPHMRHEHGDYFIAEILLGTSGSNMDDDKIIVTEDDRSVADGSTGMMWLSTATDIEELIRNFDLESLGNLVTCTPDVPHGTVQFEVFTAEQREYFNLRPKLAFLPEERVTIRTPADGPGSKAAESQGIDLLYTNFKYIRDELHNRSNYLDKVAKTLNIAFDIPGHYHKKRKYSLQDASKAFGLKNFILHPSLRLEYTYYYLCAMFSAYPDCDYCVVSVSPGTKYSVSLWALLQFFIRVQNRPSCNVSDDVFIAHRSSIYTELSVYRFVKEDLDDIYNLLLTDNKSRTESGARSTYRHLYVKMKKSSQMKIVKQISSDVIHNKLSEFSFWVIRCGHTSRDNTTTVGFAILRPFSDYEAVYKQFVLPHDDGNLTFERGEIVMLCLHPYFHMWSDELLRAVAIRSGFREIFYLQEIKGDALSNDLAPKMMPVEPRRMRRNWFIDTQAQECYRRISDQVDLSEINCVTDEFYLLRHNLMPSKYIGNKNAVVIVGFSDVCKAFLRLMIFNWNTPDYKYVSVNNCLPLLDITVIADHGEVEAEYDLNVHCRYCTEKKDCYMCNANSCPFVMDTTQRLDMRNYINFISGSVEIINRQEKYLGLDSHCKIYYDKLLLLCDTKHGLPESYEHVLQNQDLPYNYAQINGRLDKIELYHKLTEFNKVDLPNNVIIVYGSNLATYEGINFLLTHGCPASKIVSVQPHRMVHSQFENNPTSDNNLEIILLNMITDLGITVYESFRLETFCYYPSSNFIEKVHFKRFPSNQDVYLYCNLFINYMENFLPMRIARMLRLSKITVEDSRILVDEKYTTNDEFIYAAGNHVSFVWEVFYQHIYTNEREMAQKLLDILDLGMEKQFRENKFGKPCVFHARLPLNHMIIKITAPKRYLLGNLPNEYSHIISTYDGDFCRVRMNPKLFVEEIVCVTRKLERPLFFLEYFCGRHVTLLNNLQHRWKMGMIKSFITYFEEPWTEYIMHDRFDEMQVKNYEALKSMHQHMISKFNTVRDSDFRDAIKHFLEANLLQFLRKYRDEFVNKFALPEDWTT